MRIYVFIGLYAFPWLSFYLRYHVSIPKVAVSYMWEYGHII